MYFRAAHVAAKMNLMDSPAERRNQGLSPWAPFRLYRITPVPQWALGFSDSWHPWGVPGNF